METDTKNYELSFVVPEESSAGVKAVLAKNGGAVKSERPFVKIRLAYPVRKNAYGFLSSLECTFSSGVPEKLLTDLEHQAGTLRLMFTAVEKVEPQPVRREPVRSMGAVRPAEGEVLTNEALEKKIEEILK